MNQPIPNSSQEAWLQVLGKGLVTFPEGWWDELGMQNGTFVRAKKEGQRVIIETQAVKGGPLLHDGKETYSIAQLKTAQQLEQLYQFKNPEEVWHFLETHQYLVPLLLEAHSHIREYFPIADLILEYAADPEVADEEQLILSIAAVQDVDETINALKQLDRSWWFEASRRAYDNLCITVGY